MTECRLHWSKNMYSIGIGDTNTGFMRNGKVTVQVTHDLCHLFLAAGACGETFWWRPEGTDQQVRWAEAYCVAIEILLFHTFNAAISNTSPHDVSRIVEQSFRHMEHFVDVHYSPFGHSPGEFWRSFCMDLNSDKVQMYYVHYHNLRTTELRLAASLDTSEFAVEFDSEHDEAPDDSDQAMGKVLFYEVCKSLKNTKAPQELKTND